MTFEEWVEPKLSGMSESMRFVTKEMFREAWNSAVEECALAAWHRGVDDKEPGTMINRRVIAGYITSDIRAMKAID